MDEARNIRFTLEYDGTLFHGWQIQKGLRTVQGVFEAAIGQLLGGPHRVVAASRTDAGAHARGQVVSMHTRSRLSARQMVQALNSLLPEDIVVKDASDTIQDFHARWSATSRRYSYRIVVGPSALWRANSWSVRHALKLSAMEETCGGILGVGDFRAFSAAPEPHDSTLCTVIECGWAKWSEGYLFEIEADRFVRHMVRTLAGTMAKVGQDRLSVVEFLTAFHDRIRPRLAFTAPARGLCLERVRYAEVQ